MCKNLFSLRSTRTDYAEKVRGNPSETSERFWLLISLLAIWTSQSLSHCDSENKPIVWLKWIEVEYSTPDTEVEYLTPNLEYKHLLAGSVYADTSCVRINDRNPNPGEKIKTFFGEFISSFSHFLIPVRGWNE